MKQNYKLFGFAAMAALLFSGCTKDTTEDIEAPESKTCTLVIIPDAQIGAFSDDGTGTRTYWDESTENVKWVGNEYMYILMKKNQYQLVPNGNGQFSYNYNKGAVGDELFQANVPVLLTGIVPEEYRSGFVYRNITDRSQAPNKIVLTLPSAQESTAASFDPWLDVLVGSKEIVYTEAQIESNYRYEVGMPFARVMAISKYTFNLQNEKLSADETVKSVTLTVVPGEGNEEKLLTGSYNLDVSAIPARCINDKGEQINLRTPFASGSPVVSTTYAEDARPKLGELAFWPITAPVKLEAGDKLRFRIVTNKHEITKEVVLTKELYFANNQLNRATVKLDGDLSIFTFGEETIDLSAQGTANTYLISKPGTTYTFRADVKGNGVARTYAWTVEGKPVSKGYTDADLAIAPAEVKLLWYNAPKSASGWQNICPIDPESVAFDPATRIVSFTTPEMFVNGNVGIAAYDDSGEILWSWNIWAVEDYDYDLESREVGRYTVMDRNLGALAGKEAMSSSDPEAAALACGNFYQWGRKDPFPAPPTYTKSGELAGGMLWGLPTHTPITELQQDCSQQEWGATDMLYSATLASNAIGLATKLGDGYKLDDAVAVTVKYPYKWVSNGSNNDCVVDNNYTWHQKKPADNLERSEWRYLWGSVDGSTSEKSIYDPCPPGWKVPTGDMYFYLLKETSNNQYGVYSTKYDLFIPKSGQRQAGFGGSKLSGVGSAIFLATASANDPCYPYRANLGSGITNGNSYGGQGTQVRCVKEDVKATIAPQGRQAGHRAALMGDSITRTWRDRGRKEFFTENGYLNFGADGTTSQNMVCRFNTQVLADDPLCAVIAGGTNDLADNDGYFRPIEDILCNIRFMAERAEEYGAKVVIGSCFPTRDMWWKDEAWKAQYNGDFVANRIIELNKLIKAYAESKGFAYADYYSIMADETGDLKEEFWWNGTDHVHPNYDAFLLMEDILKPLIDGALYDSEEGIIDGNPIDDKEKWEWK